MKSFLSKHLGLIISTVVLFSGIVGSYAVLQYRVQQLENRVASTISYPAIEKIVEDGLGRYKESFTKDVTYLKENAMQFQAEQRDVNRTLFRLVLGKSLTTKEIVKLDKFLQ